MAPISVKSRRACSEDGMVLQLLTLYPQPVRTQGGGVEYLPVERRNLRESSAG